MDRNRTYQLVAAISDVFAGLIPCLALLANNLAAADDQTFLRTVAVDMGTASAAHANPQTPDLVSLFLKFSDDCKRLAEVTEQFAALIQVRSEKIKKRLADRDG